MARVDLSLFHSSRHSLLPTLLVGVVESGRFCSTIWGAFESERWSLVGSRLGVSDEDHRHEGPFQVLFPILRREHYFLICFDFRRYRLEQIMLSEFYNKVHNGRSILCARLVLKRMQMSWHDSKNKTDCEVYLMRHMESFVGQGVSNWDCGLVKGDYSTLHKLRLQYMKEVAVSEYNLHRARNLRRAYLLIGGPLAS
nr:zinc finger BED domain-containing protein RICESLEEPER 2-like [Ipomoea batatas]